MEVPPIIFCGEKTNTQLTNNKKKYNGLTITTNEGYKAEIIDYKGWYNCVIKLYTDLKEEKYIIIEKALRVFKKGEIKNPFHKSVHGVGYVGLGKFKPCVNNMDTVEYSRWYAMMSRCYSKSENYKAYKDIIVCDEWHDFQVFAEWFEENYIEGFHLDKDILFKGNKVYSPETCCFVPNEINNLFKTGKNKGGVRKKGNKFLASISVNNKQFYIGSYNYEDEALNACIDKKRDYIKEIANEFKNKLTKNVYDKLTTYYQTAEY